MLLKGPQVSGRLLLSLLIIVCEKNDEMKGVRSLVYAQLKKHSDNRLILSNMMV